MIILDLDDTIFETKSMNPGIFDSSMSIIKNHYDQCKSNVNSAEVINALWTYPIDRVFAEYKTKKSVISDFYNAIAEINYKELDIKPFHDYQVIKQFSNIKILVTTGLQELQYAKIKALGIENDFHEIYVDDPRMNPRRHKIDIFREILIASKIDVKNTWVIGDNPESEIKAAKSLGINTIQRKSVSKPYSELADHKIESFDELLAILKRRHQ